MHAKIDWFEFIIHDKPRMVNFDDKSLDLNELGEYFRKVGLSLVFWRMVDDKPKVFQGRGIWKFRYQFRNCSISTSEREEMLKVEFTGSGCSWLDKEGVLYPMIMSFKTTSSRVDFALDIPVKTPGISEVMDYFPLNDDGTISTPKTSSNMKSEDGHTVYVGSWNSDRFSRCYQYNPPHPRAGFCRLEAVYKGKRAKTILSNWTDYDPRKIVKASLTPFKWNVDFNEWGNLEEISSAVPRSKPDDGSWLRWVYKSAIPAVKKAVQEGSISVEVILKELGLDA